jgi:hypothetical protein
MFRGKPLRVGGTNIPNINIGNTPVSKIYIGTTLVFSTSSNRFYIIKDGKFVNSVRPNTSYITEQDGYVRIQGSTRWATFTMSPICPYTQQEIENNDGAVFNLGYSMTVPSATETAGYLFISDIPINFTAINVPSAVVQYYAMPYNNQDYIESKYDIGFPLWDRKFYFGIYIPSSIAEVKIRDLYIEKL